MKCLKQINKLDIKRILLNITHCNDIIYNKKHILL